MIEEADWSFESLVHPEHTALLIVRMQNDDCGKKGLIRKGGFSMEMTKELAPALARFLAASRQTGVTG